MHRRRSDSDGPYATIILHKIVQASRLRTRENWIAPAPNRQRRVDRDRHRGDQIKDGSDSPESRKSLFSSALTTPKYSSAEPQENAVIDEPARGHRFYSPRSCVQVFAGDRIRCDSWISVRRKLPQGEGSRLRTCRNEILRSRPKCGCELTGFVRAPDLARK